MKRTLRSIGVLAAAVIFTGCGTMTVNPIVQYLDDTATTTAIKTRLATEGSVGSLTGIGVKTRDDVVVLTGTVRDEAERQRAEAIARRVAGDNRVLSELRVASPASASISSPAKPAQTIAKPAQK
jgi:BON domain-containing protein